MKSIEVVAAIVRHKDKILCMQREKSTRDYISYKWEFPGGKIEQGESQVQALKRELKEEMDMEVEVKNFFCTVEHSYPDFQLKMHLYDCNATSNVFKLNVHKDFKWLNLSELNQLDWAEADLPVVNKLFQKELNS